MPPKRHAASTDTPTTSTTTTAPSTTTSSAKLSSGPPVLKHNSSAAEIAQHVWHQYLASTPQRTLLLDAFMAFLVLVGGIQFVYCVLVGNYPFNAFLSGFSAAVGQFVLTASLRMQTSAPAEVGSGPKGKGSSAGKSRQSEGKGVSHER